MRRRVPPVVLAIGGSDPTAGAGVEADVRTLEALGVAPAVAITAVTVQDGARVRAVSPVAPALLRGQIEAVLDTLPVAVVKCGMLARPALVNVVAATVSAAGLPLVVDPVLRASGGAALGTRSLARSITDSLLGNGAVVTPNLEEAGVLAGIEVADPVSMEEAARRILALGARAVVIKGGHLAAAPMDLLAYGRRLSWLSGSRIGHDMHGTGCAFASAFAAGLARRLSLERSFRLAREHVRSLLERAMRLANSARIRTPHT